MQHRRITESDTVSSIVDKDSSLDRIPYHSIIPNVSTEIIESGSLIRKITIRDIDVPKITVTYNLDIERRKIKNLIANGHRIDISRTDKSIE